MSFLEAPARPSLRLILIRLIPVLLLIPVLWFAPDLFGGQFTQTDRVMIVIRGVIVAAFVVIGWRDILRLFTRPLATMSTGLTRVWAVAHTTLLEAWAGRVWVLPILWLAASIILINVIRPFDETERMPLNIRTLLDMQSVLLLVMLWVMACLSLPRERERKIIMTNASKPLSRLEIVLGKMLGFWVTAALVLLVMGLASWAILGWENHRIKQTAADSFALQEADFARRAAGAPMAAGSGNAPSESTRRLRDEGSLFAWNFIPVRPNGMSIMGNVDLTANPPTRYLKGGSNEKVIYHFDQMEIDLRSIFESVGRRPYFQFIFPVEVYTERPPARVQIHVNAIRSDPHSSPFIKPQEKTINIDQRGFAAWEPENPEEIFSYHTATGEFIQNGGIDIEVTCITPGVFLHIFEGAPPNADGTYPEQATYNVIAVPDRLVANPQAWSLRPANPNPAMHGFERRDREEIAGPKDSDPTIAAQDGTGRRSVPVEVAIYRFSGDDLRKVPVDKDGNFQISLLLQIYKTDNADKPTEASVMVMTTDDMSRDPYNVVREVAEKRLMSLAVPKAFLGHGGDMLVILKCASTGHSISLAQDSVRIELPSTPFIINLFKSEIIILFEAMVLIAICVACSIRLGWPVAMLLTAMCVLFGYMVEFLAGLQQYGGLGALNYHANGMPSATFQFFDKITSSTWASLGVISAFVPNFTIYHPADFVSNLQNTPWSVLGWNGFYTALFIAPIIAVAYLLFRKQEVS